MFTKNILPVLCVLPTLVVAADSSTYPVVPYAGTEVTASDMIDEARVQHNRTRFSGGFQVTDAFGNTFFTDDIDDPRCAVYTNVVEVQEGAFINPTLQVQQTVNIDQINFDSCF